MNRKSIYIGCIPGATNEEKFANAAKAGFAAIEPSGVATVEERQALKELYAKYNLICPSVMTSGNWEFPASSPDADIREKAAQCYRNAILTAAYLGADTILAVPGKVDPDTRYEDAWENSRKTIELVIPFARKTAFTSLSKMFGTSSFSARAKCANTSTASTPNGSRLTSMSATSCSTVIRSTGSSRSAS
nr:TIM barrel protein [Clostridia bacterium]